MSEILRTQYESTFSSPDTEVIIETLDLDNFFKVLDKGAEDKEETEDEDEPAAKDDRVIEKTSEEEIEDRDHNNIPSESDRQPILTDVPCDFMDIADAIDQLATSSGPCPDGISAILLKKSKITVSLMLRNIFEHKVSTGEIPEILKTGFICPILKPDSRREKAVSWRPVSLTSHVMKTMERVVRRRIVNHLEYHELLDVDQHGSRQNKSCLSQLLEHHEDILKMLEKCGNVDVIYTDFEKAYEKVDFIKLLNKMKTQYQITGKIGKWLHNFFKDRSQQVLIEETLSEKSEVKSGAIQGSV